MLYTMKETCNQVQMNYEALKFYCREGLVPNVKRDENNFRLFDERDIAWIKGVQCLRRCGMGIREIKEYMGVLSARPGFHSTKKRHAGKYPSETGAKNTGTTGKPQIY